MGYTLEIENSFSPAWLYQENNDLAPDQCMTFIIEELWRQLQKTHILRLLENKEG
jgi:hypothetical protein